MLKKLTQKRNKKGFTLVELVVVIAILGILAAIAVPRLSGFQNSAAEKADKATAATIAKAAELYAVSNNLKEEEIVKKSNKLIGDISSADNVLKTKDLINSDLAPQVKTAGTGNKFYLHYGKRSIDSSNVFYVTYEATGDTKALYPEDFTGTPVTPTN